MNPMRVAMRVDDFDPDCRVITGEPLPDVVQEGADEEEVGSFDRVGEFGSQRDSFQQMTVDGEGVVGVALGLVADGCPFRDEPDQQTVLVQGFDLVDGGMAESEQIDEGGPASPPPTGRPAEACGRPVGATSPGR